MTEAMFLFDWYSPSLDIPRKTPVAALRQAILNENSLVLSYLILTAALGSGL